jgi:hypothetical protein
MRKEKCGLPLLVAGRQDRAQNHTAFTLTQRMALVDNGSLIINLSEPIVGACEPSPYPR